MNNERTAPRSTPGGRIGPVLELYSIVSFWVFVWGLGIGAALLVAEVLSDASFTWRFSVGGVALFSTVGATLFLLKKSPALSNRIDACTPLIMMIAAGLVGYAWHDQSYRNSHEAINQKAALWACAKLPECRASAQEYGGLTGKNIHIAPQQR